MACHPFIFIFILFFQIKANNALFGMKDNMSLADRFWPSHIVGKPLRNMGFNC